MDVAETAAGNWNWLDGRRQLGCHLSMGAVVGNPGTRSEALQRHTTIAESSRLVALVPRWAVVGTAVKTSHLSITGMIDLATLLKT
jgi:hypothetical protein